MSFENSRPRPARRRPGRNSPRYTASYLFALLIVGLSMVSVVAASDREFNGRAYGSRQYKKLERLGQIHIDTRPAPSVPEYRIERRQLESSSASPTSTSTSSSSPVPSTESTKSPSLATTSTSERSKSTTTAGYAATPSVVQTPIPSPFDTSLGSNFTSETCPTFFTSFLANATFKSCHPISLLLQNSNSFFQAERSDTLLVQTLNLACDAPLVVCSPLMASLAAQLVEDSNCGLDYQNQNPLVRQAYNGLLAYEPLYRGTCLKNPATGDYCFADAILNTLNPSDSYPYYTALGLNMPPATRPTCTPCLQNTMAAFAAYAGLSDQPLRVTYTPTAYQIDLACGPTFVNTTVPARDGRHHGELSPFAPGDEAGGIDSYSADGGVPTRVGKY